MTYNKLINHNICTFKYLNIGLWKISNDHQYLVHSGKCFVFKNILNTAIIFNITSTIVINKINSLISHLNNKKPAE